MILSGLECCTLTVIVVHFFVGLIEAWFIVMGDGVGEVFGFSEPEDIDPCAIPAQNMQVDK